MKKQIITLFLALTCSQLIFGVEPVWKLSSETDVKNVNATKVTDQPLAYSYDGTSSHLMTNVPMLDDRFSFNVWAKAAQRDGRRVVISKTGFHNMLFFNDMHPQFLVWTKDKKPVSIKGRKRCDAERFYMLTGVCDRTRVSLYVNGERVVEAQLLNIARSNSGNLYIGCNTQTGSDKPLYFTGLIGEVEIYNTPLSDEQVSTMYQHQRDAYENIPAK